MAYFFLRMPTSYLPDEDQGLMYAMATLPSGSTLEQTAAVMTEIRKYFLEDEKDVVANCFTMAGRGFAGTGQNVGLGFISLRDWDLRKQVEHES